MWAVSVGGVGPLHAEQDSPRGPGDPQLRPALAQRAAGSPGQNIGDTSLRPSRQICTARVPTREANLANGASPQPAGLALSNSACRVCKGRNALSYLASLESLASRGLLCHRAIPLALALPAAPAALSVLGSLGGHMHP